MASVDEMNFVTAFYAPGIVVQNAETTLPANYPEIEQLLGCMLIESDGTDLAKTNLAIKTATATPGTGYISLTGGNTFRLGTAATAKARLVMCYKAVSGVNDKKLITAVLVPGAYTADAAGGVELPAYYPEIDYIIGGTHLQLAIDDIVRIALTGKIPTGTLASGYVSKLYGNTIIMGNSTTTATLVVLTYRAV